MHVCDFGSSHLNVFFAGVRVGVGAGKCWCSFRSIFDCTGVKKVVKIFQNACR